jgi:serine/threonine protein kinase
MRSGEPLATGHMLDGRYRTDKVIGVGGMGRVYLAHDTRLANRPVAVKEMMVGEGVQERKAVEDFAREARVLAPLSHPGIPNLIDYFAERGRHYLVMEYIAGGDLQGWLDQRGAGARVREAQVLRWARELLDVLSFLHSQTPPIVYRDLKPGNIMIDQNERAMLIDFGIARFLPPGGRGTQIGSVGYAPPEQYLGKLEPRSDLYSLAATMHHLLTGRDPQLEPPFSFPQVRQLVAEVSAETERVVMWALEREADHRPASAAAMLEALPHPPADDEPWMAAPRVSAADAASSSMARMRTAVLSKPAPAPARSANPAPRPSAVPAPAATPTVSSTAKTADLKGKLKPVSSTPKQRPPAPTPAQRPNAYSQAARPRPAASVITTSQRQPQGALVQPTSQRNGVSSAVTPPTVSAPKASLVSKTEDRRFAIGGSRMVIGRRSSPADELDIDLSVLKVGGERVSRRHAEILQRGEDYFVRDLGSLNGTFILGQGRLGRDQLYKLQDRDQVVIGGATLEFRKGGAA